MNLNPVQLRVLGSLIEKEIATPENYPLSLNALLSACNQRSSRDPVMELAEEEVRQALHGLEEMKWVSVVRDGRVAKFEHRVRTALNLRRDETAVLCLLLLRGPQTLGELRGRSERLYAFDDIEAVQATLERMAARPEEAQDPGETGPLVKLLPRQPGSREARWAHLLGGPVEAAAAEPAEAGSPGAGRTAADTELLERISRLEAEVAELRAALARMEAKLAESGAISSRPEKETP